MDRPTLRTVIDHVRRISHGAEAAPSDRDLLATYAKDGSEKAFGLLVERHAGFVLRTCKRILGNNADVDDAFQATFMVLARKAGQISVRESLIPWLYRVACRAANRLRTQALTRKNHETSTMPRSSPSANDSAELMQVLDQEVQRLPGKYRAPVVLCCLEGKTHEEAALNIGCSPGSVWYYLNQAQQLLRARLEKRGFAVSSAAFAALMQGEAEAVAVSPTLIRSTTELALSWASGRSPAVVARSALLARDILRASALQRMAFLSLVAIFVLGVTGLGLYACFNTGRPNVVRGTPRLPQPMAEVSLPKNLTVQQFAISPRHVALATDIGEAVIVESGTGKVLGSHAGFKNARTLTFLKSLDWLPDGNLVWATSSRSEVLDWQGKVLQTLEQIRVIAVSPDGRWLAGCGPSNKTLIVWDRERQQLASGFRQDFALTPRFAFSQDSQVLVVGELTGKVAIWNTRDGTLQRTLHGEHLGGHLGAVARTSFVVVAKSGLHIIDLVTGKLTTKVPIKISADLRANNLGFSRDGRYLVGVDADSKRIQAWDCEQGRMLVPRSSCDFPANGIAFTSVGTLAVHQAQERRLTLWNLESLFEVHDAR